MKLTFKIDLLSDYHIGAGHGKGIVDSVILKDEQGLPIIRGTTLSGLLRQGMWDLLQLDLLQPHRYCKQSGDSSGFDYCFGHDPGSRCPICRTLGTPASEKKWRFSSAVIEDSAMKPGMAAWRNRVNPRTRRAEARKLFSEEIVGKSVNFLFSLTNDLNDARVLEEAAFIVAAFRMVRNLGSSRRRGKGQCQIHLDNATPSDLEIVEGASQEDHFLDLFKSVWLENNKLVVSNSISQSRTIKKSLRTKKVFNMVLVTEEPLLIAEKSESGNMYYTNRGIPGYTLLGALAWKAANNFNLDDKAVYEQFIKLFRRGGVKVSPLYPALKIRDYIYPSILSPQDFLSCKLYPEFEEFGHGVKGYATETEEPEMCEQCLREEIETPLEPMAKYLAIKKHHKHLEAIEVPMREEMHITIDPVKGRTITGDLFGYKSIDSGTYFVGTIEIADWTNFVNFLGLDGENPVFELRIGKASSRGHGKVKVWLQSDESVVNLFLGKSLKERVNDLTKPLRMALITDAILVDTWGRFLNKLDESFLENLLDVEVGEINTYVKSKNVDGFNAYLGLPKWRDVAIIAGSSIGFKIEHPEDKEAILKRLEKLEIEGIGIRKEEGFGKIAFNHPVYDKNEGVEMGIHLPVEMRIKEKRKATVNFEDWWTSYAKENIIKNRKLFADPYWRAVSRWIRANSGESIEKINIDNFHTLEEPLSTLINQRQALRDKKNFLEKDGKEGKDALKKVLEDLTNKLQEEDENIREYMNFKAIETLADFIASCIEEEKV
jgi:CRISPR-associated protein Csx10